MRKKNTVMKVLMFGATGSAGSSILPVCLADSRIDEVLAITRRPLETKHDKLRVIINKDYSTYTAIEEAFEGMDACFYCLGIAVSQTSGEAEYRKITYDFAMAAAKTVQRHSPHAIFHFISGEGANLSSRFMWARVKAETERDLMASVNAVCWRPGFIDSEPSHTTPRHYKLLRPLMKMLKPVQNVYIDGRDIG
ncbi:MAG TPA: hypothetical protein VEF04_08165, partial [Blastocatellia bacterium]|nr:hypothetical protein [Blastocatellia bacterium]